MAAAAPHGGGAFSGKDPTKVDRSAAYAARYLAKNVVAAGLAERCTIQVAYAIGVAKPLSFYVDTDGAVDEDKLSRVLQELMDLSPRGIRTHLGLNQPIYAPTSAYGHFGRAPEADGGFSWERLDLVDELRRALLTTRGARCRRASAGLRAPARPGAAPRQAGADRRIAAADCRCRSRTPAGSTRLRFTARRRMGSGSRSALAPASISPPRPSRYPEIGFIGCEVFENGVVRLLGEIERRRLGNVRIFADDARLLLAALPPRRSPASSSCSPTPGQSGAITSAASCRARRSIGSPRS